LWQRGTQAHKNDYLQSCMETILVSKLAAYQGYMKIIRRSLMEWFVDSLRCQPYAAYQPIHAILKI